MLPNGKRLVSSEDLLARYRPKVMLGEDATYGMALMVEKRYTPSRWSTTAVTSPATTAT
jgi:hypothetical protein